MPTLNPARSTFFSFFWRLEYPQTDLVCWALFMGHCWGNERVFFGKILVYAQCPSCPLPFRPSEMPFPQNDLPFNALHQNALSEMPFQICPSSKCPFGNANSNMPFQKCPFKNALSQFALSQFALYQIAVYHKCNIFIYFRLWDFK